MKIQFKILMFMVCLNLSIGLLIGLNVAGTTDISPTAPSDSADYEEHYNATATVSDWKENIITGIPILGDIFSGLNFLWQNINYLLDGFPMFLNWLSDSYVTDPSAKTAFNLVCGALRALYAILMSIFALEFLSGRIMSD